MEMVLSRCNLYHGKAQGEGAENDCNESQTVARNEHVRIQAKPEWLLRFPTQHIRKSIGSKGTVFHCGYFSPH